MINNSILHYKGRNRAIAWVWSLLCPSETRAAITRNAFAVFCFEQCILFFIATLLRIWLAVTVERVETATFNPRVENHSFNPLYRYRKSDFQRRRYEKNITPIKNGHQEIYRFLWNKQFCFSTFYTFIFFGRKMEFLIFTKTFLMDKTGTICLKT